MRRSEVEKGVGRRWDEPQAIESKSGLVWKFRPAQSMDC
jgi:hypothetical protein